ncbi:hypothetical protein QZH41_001163 [Actinostola sp. cb2023]|nr:hypothetical protein QZH41_001163 [Actinostola sp. cb2023]
MLHQDYYNSDEDFGDMLIADYRDSDESASEDKPPLPGSPPVDVEDLSSNDDESSKKMMPFHKIPLGDWTEDDTLQWLHYVGLGHFKEQFKAHHVNGRTLKNINFQLLEEIGISAPDERELVLAEIYELDNPSEEDHLEAEIQGINQAMEDSDCPLTWQCRWNDPEKYRFEMRCRDEGSVRMLFEIEGFEGDLDYRSILVSSRTPCKDVLPLIVKKYDLPGKVDDYQLMEVSEDNEDDRRVVADHVCPLKLQNAWSEPDHVFRLVRKHVTSPAVPIQPQRAPQIITEKSSEIRNELPRTHSNTSSVKDGYETESIDHPDNTSEEADLPGINKELEEVVMEVQDSISSQQVHQGNVGRTKEHSFALLSHVEEMSRKKDAELAAKETEIEELKKERDELLENESELLVWRMRNKELVERENAIEELKKERDELLENESELLVWRMRNKELVEREEELEELQSSLFEQESQKQLKNEKELVELRSKCLELSEKEHVAKALEQKHVQAAVDELENSMKSKDEELLAREHEIERLYQRNSELLNKEKETQELRDQIKDFTGFQREFENLEKENSKSRAKQKDLETKVHRLEQENDSLRSQSVREDDGVTLIPDTLNVNSAEIKEMRLKLEAVEKDNQELLRTSNDLQRRNQLLEESAKLLDSMREENQSLLAKTKEIEGMKRNIIKLTSQLRQADNLRLNQEELERHNMNLRDDLLETDRLRKENRTLTEKVNELEEVRRSVEINEIKEGDALRQKLLRMQDVEKSMTKELNTKEAILQQKDGKIEEMEKKIRAMTDAMKKMEAKFRDQNEQRENLTRLLTIIKDKDPSLLKTLHRSIITRHRCVIIHGIQKSFYQLPFFLLY